MHPRGFKYLHERPHLMGDNNPAKRADVRLKISKNRKAVGNKSGVAASHWQGGMWLYQRKKALMRDNYTCQICGISEKEILCVDHIKPRRDYPDLIYILENLLTLCYNCHARKTFREKEFRNK